MAHLAMIIELGWRTQRIESEDLRDPCDGASGKGDIERQSYNAKEVGLADRNGEVGK
jgi:hypothetical protein